MEEVRVLEENEHQYLQVAKPERVPFDMMSVRFDAFGTHAGSGGDWGSIRAQRQSRPRIMLASSDHAAGCRASTFMAGRCVMRCVSPCAIPLGLALIFRDI